MYVLPQKKNQKPCYVQPMIIKTDSQDCVYMTKKINTKEKKSPTKIKGQQIGIKGLCVNLVWKLEQVHPSPQVIQQLLQRNSRDKTLLTLFNTEHTLLMKQRKRSFYPGGLFQFLASLFLSHFDPACEAWNLRPESVGSCCMSFNATTSRAITLTVRGTEKPKWSSFLTS